MSARTKNNNPWKWFLLSAVLVLLVTASSIFFIHEPIPTRIGVVIVGNPTVVLSYDQTRKTMLAVRIPPEVYVDMARGYGSYPISSVWKLDSMDKRKGVVLTETMEESTGIPIRFFINSQSDGGKAGTTNTQIGDALSFFSSLRLLFGKNQTNIPPAVLFELSQSFGGMNPTDFVSFDLSEEAVFIDTTLADGTRVKKIDPGRLALVLGTHAEDAQIRKENLRIAVFNSTKSPGLAQKATRIMEVLGFHVSSIANRDGMELSRCMLKGKKDIQKFVTVRTLQWLYGCIFEETGEDFQNDLSLIFGTDFEKRFLPY